MAAVAATGDRLRVAFGVVPVVPTPAAGGLSDLQRDRRRPSDRGAAGWPRTELNPATRPAGCGVQFVVGASRADAGGCVRCSTRRGACGCSRVFPQRCGVRAGPRRLVSFLPTD